MNRLAGKAARVFVLTALIMMLLAITAFAADGDPLVIDIGKTTGSSIRMRQISPLLQTRFKQEAR